MQNFGLPGSLRLWGCNAFPKGEGIPHKMQNSAGADLLNLATRKEEEMKKMKFSIFIVRRKYEEKKCKIVKQVLSYTKS